MLELGVESFAIGTVVHGPMAVGTNPAHEVDVGGDVYVWQDQRYRSLTAIARAITGTKWSGPRFFGLSGRS